MGALFHVMVILGAAVPKFIHSPFFYPCCAVSFAGIVALIYDCIGCTGRASIAKAQSGHKTAPDMVFSCRR